MKTSIIIPTYNNEEYTIRCMESICNHTEDYIILWVDDASTKESVEKVKSFLDEQSVPYELIAKKENSGFAKSVNLGLARALELESEYIVIQNNDTEVFEDWLVRMIEAGGRERKIGAVGPVTSPCESWQSVDNLREEFNQFANLPVYEDNPSRYAQQISELYTKQYLLVHKRLAFFCVVFKADIIRQIGMLSEEYGIGFGEDDDYMLRMRQIGYFGAIAKDVFVFHNHNTTFSGEFSEQEIQAMREQNREILYRKFKKGRFRPKDIDQIWDIEEVIAYAKQLEKLLQQKNELLEKKDGDLREKTERLRGWDERLRERNERLRKKDEEITGKNGKIGEQAYRLKKKEEQIASLDNQLNKFKQKVKNIQDDTERIKRELAASRIQLESVFQSFSWRMTAPLRKMKKIFKRS